MLDCPHVKVGTTHRLLAVFVDAAGSPKTGLSVTVRILRKSDGLFLQSDGAWSTSPGDEYTATAIDAASLPGVYGFDWTVPATLDEYIVRFDGGADAANRYQFGQVRSAKVDVADLHKIKAALVNKQVQTINSGVVAIKDDDGETDLLTLTPDVDDVDNPTQNILSPT